MSKAQIVHKNWCDLMVARARKRKEQSDYPYKLMMWKENNKWR